MKENPPCTTDDDDDEGDDDEYCYSKGAPELIAQLNVNYFRIFQEWRDISCFYIYNTSINTYINKNRFRSFLCFNFTALFGWNNLRTRTFMYCFIIS